MKQERMNNVENIKREPIKAGSFAELMKAFERDLSLMHQPMQPAGQWIYDVCKKIVDLERQVAELTKEVRTLYGVEPSIEFEADKRQTKLTFDQTEPTYTREQLCEMAKRARGDAVRNPICPSAPTDEPENISA